MTEFIVVTSALLLLAGILLIVIWGGNTIRPPAPNVSIPDRRAALSLALRRYLWWANLGCFAALASSLLMAGPGSRLVMRILAMTSPDSSQGRLTEAGFNVGFVTLPGTVSLLVFVGLPAAFFSALMYLLIHQWLPSGRLSGPLAGLFGLILLGAADPLRADNIDFRIVGPGWLSVLLFSLLVILQGALVAALAGWFSQRLPLPTKRTWAYYIPLVIGVVFPPVTILVVFGALVVMVWVVAARRSRFWNSSVYLWAGRAVLAVAVLIALPTFVPNVGAILAM